jgi:hypothetical protein
MTDHNTTTTTAVPAAVTTTPEQRVGEFLIALGNLKEGDIYTALKLDEIDPKFTMRTVKRYVRELQEIARANDNAGKTWDEFWRKILADIKSRAAIVSAAGAGTDETKPS